VSRESGRSALIHEIVFITKELYVRSTQRIVRITITQNGDMNAKLRCFGQVKNIW